MTAGSERSRHRGPTPRSPCCSLGRSISAVTGAVADGVSFASPESQDSRRVVAESTASGSAVVGATPGADQVARPCLRPGVRHGVDEPCVRRSHSVSDFVSNNST